jgi:Flp pilus assembly protein TadD
MQDRSLYFASLAHIDAYLKSYDSTPEVQRLRADALRATDQADAAEAQYRALLPTTQAAAAWHGLGLLAGQRGDYPAAIADFREAVQREPINADMLNDLGYALLCGGDRAAARLPLMQAIELAPDNRKIVSNLALFLLLSNEREKAEGLMRSASFPAEVRTEVFRQAAKIGGTAIAATPALPAVLSANFMQPMLERFRSAE